MSYFRDLIGLIGAASVAYGSWLYAEPLGFIIGGLLLVAYSYISAATAPTKKEAE